MTALNVIARNPGHYADRHRRQGDAFTLAVRGDFAANWMEAVGWDPKAPAEPKADPDPAPEPRAEPAPETPAEPKAAKPRTAKSTANET